VRADSIKKGKSLSVGSLSQKVIFPRLPHLPLAVSSFATLGFPHMTDDELCRQDPCSKLLTLASLPLSKGVRMLVEGRHAVVYATENPSRTGRKYHAFHPSSRESPCPREIWVGMPTASSWPSTAESRAKKKIEGDHSQLLNGNGTLKSDAASYIAL
jgi:hypothetical protein